jgi:mono/diheme cytochrome c family protein
LEELFHRSANDMTSRLPNLVMALCLALPSVAVAQMSPSEQRGQTFVHANCSNCHATDRVSASSLKVAPPFRELHLRYPVESLQEALVEGVRTGHANMPEFQLDPGQASDVIAYLKTLER